jgi:hypothetical protein
MGLTIRARGLLVAAAAAALLIAGSPVRIAGDGGEYAVQALNFAELHAPPLGRKAILSIRPRLGALDAHLTDWSIERAAVAGRDHRYDFPHFWFYALLATPYVWLTSLFGLNALWAFTLLNVTLLGIAIGIVLPRAGIAATLLIFAGPALWWIDKAHTEIFTVALVSIAVALMRERPGWAMVAAGAAATQNPPIAVLCVLIGVMHVAHVRWRGGPSGPPALAEPEGSALRKAMLQRADAIAAAIGLALCVLQPVYTYARHGTPSLLLAATHRGRPAFAELTAVLIDPNIGLLFMDPAFVLAVVIGLVVLARRDRRALVSADLLVAAATACVFLVAFSSTANVRHGATPGLSRYALWLLPLAIPLIVRANAAGGRVWRVTLAALVIVSTTMSVWIFHPARPENWTQPTRLSWWLWTHHPAWSNPLPEVFTETIRHTDSAEIPASTPGCEKILIDGAAPDGRVWPLPCQPVSVPAWCRGLCYANRAGDAYTFTRAAGRTLIVRNPMTWPPDAEAQAREWFATRGWTTLTPLPPYGLDVLRTSSGVGVAAIGSASRFVLFLVPTQPDATLTFRLPGPMTGELLDPRSGRRVDAVRFDGPAGDLWSIGVPPNHAMLVLDMQPAAAR